MQNSVRTTKTGAKERPPARRLVDVNTIAAVLSGAPAPRLVGLPDFAAMLGISARSAWRIVRRRELPVVRLAGRTLFNVVDIDAYIARCTDASPAGGR